jgi:salicylate hydroxylase
MMKVTFEDGTTTTANLVVGADGIHSNVRSHYIVSFIDPARHDRNNKSCIDAIAQGDNAQYGNMVVYRSLCPISKLRDWWPFQTYSVAWLARGKHMLVFPISSDNTLNVVSFVTTKKEDLGDTTQESWTMTGDKDSVRHEFRDFDAPVQRIIEAMDTKPLKWILYDRQPSKQWVFAGGKVVLLGDAAHAMLPHQGETPFPSLAY